jgi:hypothetical protein
MPVFVENWTTSLTVPPPAMSPAEHDTVCAAPSEAGRVDGVHGFGPGVGGGFEKTFDPFTKRARLLTVTGDGNVTPTTTFEAVDAADSFVKVVIEIASLLAVMTCGVTVWETQDALLVGVDGVAQIAPLAARPPLAKASSAAIPPNATTQAPTPN